MSTGRRRESKIEERWGWEISRLNRGHVAGIVIMMSKMMIEMLVAEAVAAAEGLKT